MAKLKSKLTGTVYKDLDDLTPGKNSRTEYDPEKLEELADSISKRGLIHSIGIDSKGNIHCGYRRYFAHKILVERGEDFRTIRCEILQGDTVALNLIENIQREELSPSDTEKALKRLLDEGNTQKQIAEMLNKSIQWVSDALAAERTREKAESKGADTSGMSTSAVSAMRSVPEDKIPAVVKKAKDNGGTVKATTQAVKEISDTAESFIFGDKEEPKDVKKTTFKSSSVSEIDRLKEKLSDAVELLHMVKAQCDMITKVESAIDEFLSTLETKGDK